MLHAARVEDGSPAPFVVPRELEIVALVRHADRDPPDTGPGVQPSADGVKGPIIRGEREPGESEGCPQELSRWSSTGYSITRSACSRIVFGIVSPSALSVFRLTTSSNLVGCSTGRSPGLAPLKILSTTTAFGSREAASDAFARGARQLYEQDDLAAAMRRFNEAWLLEIRTALSHIGDSAPSCTTKERSTRRWPC